MEKLIWLSRPYVLNPQVRRSSRFKKKWTFSTLSYFLFSINFSLGYFLLPLFRLHPYPTVSLYCLFTLFITFTILFIPCSHPFFILTFLLIATCLLLSLASSTLVPFSHASSSPPFPHPFLPADLLPKLSLASLTQTTSLTFSSSSLW